jgi:hypothetical protein
LQDTSKEETWALYCCIVVKDTIKDGKSEEASGMMLCPAWLFFCQGFLLSASGLEKPAHLGALGGGGMDRNGNEKLMMNKTSID